MKKTTLFIFFCLKIAIATAQLPSIIDDDYIIRKSMSPLKFNKTYVTKDATLFIEPGAVVEGNKLEIDGTLILIGTKKDSITIRIKHLQTNHKIIAKYCKFDQTGLDIRGFEAGTAEFKNCVFTNSGLDNSCKTLSCEDNLFISTSVQSRNGMAIYKDNRFKSSPISIKDYGAATIEHNQFWNTNNTINIDEGDNKANAIITIRNNRFELDSLLRNNYGGNIAIQAEFSTPSNRTVLIENNVIRGYQKAFALVVSYNGVYQCETTHFTVVGNQVEHCNTILSVNPHIGCKLGAFVVKNNRFSDFQIAFIEFGGSQKKDKKAFLSYRINKNKYDIPLVELLKRIDDFTGDYEKWVRFEVEY